MAWHDMAWLWQDAESSVKSEAGQVTVSGVMVMDML